MYISLLCPISDPFTSERGAVVTNNHFLMKKFRSSSTRVLPIYENLVVGGQRRRPVLGNSHGIGDQNLTSSSNEQAVTRRNSSSHFVCRYATAVSDHTGELYSKNNWIKAMNEIKASKLKHQCLYSNPGDKMTVEVCMSDVSDVYSCVRDLLACEDSHIAAVTTSVNGARNIAKQRRDKSKPGAYVADDLLKLTGNESLSQSRSCGNGGHFVLMEAQQTTTMMPIDIIEHSLSKSYVQKPNFAREREIHLSDLQRKLPSIYDGVMIVDNPIAAKAVVNMLRTKYRHLVHACDTEVAKIDIKDETPIHHGEIICFSIYSGPHANFNGKSYIWVDVLDGGREVLKEFGPFFEDPLIRKVWHNYSFDRHILENYGIKVSGFHADTVHLARLWDSSRRANGGYSLEALTADDAIIPSGSASDGGKLLSRKLPMKSIFGKKKIKKDGSEGKTISISPVEILQREERVQWICYSVLDSVNTLRLFESLQAKLMMRQWALHGQQIMGSMYDFYEEYWRPFGELLVEMESQGMLVDRVHLANMAAVASSEKKVLTAKFREWASKHCPDAKYMNVGSDAQLRQLFYGGIANRKNQDLVLPEGKGFRVPNVENAVEVGKKSPSKFRTINLHKIGNALEAESFTATGWPSISGDCLKGLAGNIAVTDDCFEEPSGPTSERGGVTGRPYLSSVDCEASAYGTAYKAFGGGTEGREACHAIAALCKVCSIETLISNFILPLQGNGVLGKTGRVHCSLNINTETGRLSARRPSLQNQPALEKDRYKIRQAFVAAPGCSLIVADYGQLELRLLAHLANCKSMLDAFKAGGDFHSRTAMNMYPHIRKAVENGNILLEWFPEAGETAPPVPLLKDEFASERRKAKLLNFSIAYGKTPVGLSRDWKISVKEAKETLRRWYNERQEVLLWQEARKKEALTHHCVYTLLGRARHFPSLHNASNAQKGHIERAAINTPVQGSAADVAMCAMLEISKNVRLRELGWKLLLQVHDEMILEGPSESADAARAIVVDCMSKPFKGENILKVDLAVVAKCAPNWYAAK